MARTRLADDFLSGDKRRILHATWAVVHSRDPEELDPLLPLIAKIRKAVEPVDLGGMIRSNWANFEYALDKLDDYRRGLCWCETYTGLDQFDPRKEEAFEHVRIVSTSEPGWSMTYEVECLVCHRVFDVEQGDHHVMWWKWVPRGEKRTNTRGR